MASSSGSADTNLGPPLAERPAAPPQAPDARRDAEAKLRDWAVQTMEGATTPEEGLVALRAFAEAPKNDAEAFAKLAAANEPPEVAAEFDDILKRVVGEMEAAVAKAQEKARAIMGTKEADSGAPAVEAPGAKPASEVPAAVPAKAEVATGTAATVGEALMGGSGVEGAKVDVAVEAKTKEATTAASPEPARIDVVPTSPEAVAAFSSRLDALENSAGEKDRDGVAVRAQMVELRKLNQELSTLPGAERAAMAERLRVLERRLAGLPEEAAPAATEAVPAKAGSKESAGPKNGFESAKQRIDPMAEFLAEKHKGLQELEAEFDAALGESSLQDVEGSAAQILKTYDKVLGALQGERAKATGSEQVVRLDTEIELFRLRAVWLKARVDAFAAETQVHEQRKTEFETIEEQLAAAREEAASEADPAKKKELEELIKMQEGELEALRQPVAEKLQAVTELEAQMAARMDGSQGGLFDDAYGGYEYDDYGSFSMRGDGEHKVKSEYPDYSSYLKALPPERKLPDDAGAAIVAVLDWAEKKFADIGKKEWQKKGH
jgi:hypothetical protein